jgi:protein-S-isoprenylcysteine O-methyltransferase Ste14
MALSKYIQNSVLIPAALVIVIPVVLLLSTSTVKIGWGLHTPFNLMPLLVGAIVTIAGLVAVGMVMLQLAPDDGGADDSGEQLVTHGLYQYVRQPLALSIMVLLLGETILLGSWILLVWLVIVIAGNVYYVPAMEEPTLARRFGEEYLAYQKRVPRWIPRNMPWSS